MKTQEEETVTIPKAEYDRLKQIESAFEQEMKNKNTELILKAQQQHLASVVGAPMSLGGLL